MTTPLNSTSNSTAPRPGVGKTEDVQPQGNSGLASNATTTFFQERGRPQPVPLPLSQTHVVATGIPTNDPSQNLLDETFTELFGEEPGSGSPSSFSETDAELLLKTTLTEFLEELEEKELEAKPGNSSNSSTAPYEQNLEALEMSFAQLQLLENPDVKAQIRDNAFLKQQFEKSGEEINALLGRLISFFKELLNETASSLPTWLDSKSDYIDQLLPFSVSKLFQDNLPKLSVFSSYLDSRVIDEWAQYYPLCIAKLKENGLQGYIDQKPEKGWFSKMASGVAPSNLGPFGNGPTPAQIIQQCNIFMEDLTVLTAFNNEIIKRKNDPGAIKAFIDEAKKRSDYSFPFNKKNILLGLIYSHLLIQAAMASIKLDQLGIDQWLESDIECEQIMSHSELASYLDEKSPDASLDSLISLFANSDIEKSALQWAEKDAPLFEGLLAELERQPIDRPVIEKKLLEYRKAFCEMKILKCVVLLTKGNSALPPLIELYTKCCFKLIDAKFKHPPLFIGEGLLNSYKAEHAQTQVPFSSTTPPLASSSKPDLSPTDQLKVDTAFFIELLAQTDEKVEAWLQEKSGNDYLVRGKQNRVQVKELLKEVDRETVRAWVNIYDASIEKLSTEKLKHLLPQ